MYNPTTRLLTLLEMLQARGRISGAELSDRLEVDARSVRRYVAMLQDIGIPITSERGRYGGYELRRGFRVPPMMFTEDEALALTLGLLTVRHLSLVGAAPAIEGALAKIDRVLPETSRAQLRALQETLTIDLPPADPPPTAQTVFAVTSAARDRLRLHVRYQSDGGETERDIDPYGLVYRTGRWYAVAWCHLRRDVRTFRIDRILSTAVTEERFQPPQGFDAHAHLIRTLASRWTGWTAEVVLGTTPEEARRWISPIVGPIEAHPDGAIVRIQADDLGWTARYLLDLPWPMTILSPPELDDALARLQDRIQELRDAKSPRP
jgi:predicted DNA-binding transcriptional regulator YafY